ncbi:MAG: AcrR family transcriptional regulator, partial [Saprospiraceae bacterium]
MKSRKEEIKSAAARLFRKKGYSATSMRDIATAVGIKAASIYNHFKGKQELLQMLLMNIAYLFEKG